MWLCDLGSDEPRFLVLTSTDTANSRAKHGRLVAAGAGGMSGLPHASFRSAPAIVIRSSLGGGDSRRRRSRAATSVSERESLTRARELSATCGEVVGGWP